MDDESSDALLREIARIDDVTPPEPEVDLTGSSLGRFRVLSLLGKGGMGVVYLAEDEALRREVALKVLASSVAEDPDRRRRLLREARAAAAVSHASIAGVYEVGEAEGLLYIAMERVQGESLRARIERGPIPLEEALRIAKQALEGLAKAHEAGIVHRDLKPENVMVDNGGGVKILDFGLAKFTEVEVEPGKKTTMLTEEGRLMGTPSYMSPEQAAGLPLDVRSDVFSFGIVFYEMVTGELPFQGSNFLKILAAIERDEPAPPSRKNAAISSDIERIILRCLKKDPAERYANARDVLRDLEEERPATGRSARRAPKWLGATLVGAVVVVAGVFGLASRMGGAAKQPIPSSSVVATSSALSGPVSTPITELPLPQTKSPEALAAYREGLQGLRDGSWSKAYHAFTRSVELDPMLGAGHLRAAQTGPWNTAQSEVRAAFRKAISFRDALSERDRRLLDVLSPVLMQDPPDPEEGLRRIVAAAQQYPGDAEWVAMQGSMLFVPDRDPVELLEVSDRCLALDPRYADCLQGRAVALGRLGRLPEAFQSIQRCKEVSPAGNDCIGEGRIFHQAAGQCAEMEADVRAMIANDREESGLYDILAASLFAEGRPLATVRAALEQGREIAPPKEREQAADWAEVLFAYLTGRFEEAERRTLARAQRDAQTPFERIRASAMHRLVNHYEVLGRAPEAAKVAEEYLAGRDVWTKSFFRTIGTDSTLWAMKRKLDAKLMSREAFVAERAAYVARWEKRLPPEMRGLVWLLAYANLAKTPEEAREALDAKPPMKPLEYYGSNPADSRSAMGKVLVLAGRHAEAIPYLEKAVADCGGFFRPIGYTLDHYRLGIAKEALGDEKGACASYKIVLDRWGNAKPRVPAAEDTRARAKNLGCET